MVWFSDRLQRLDPLSELARFSDEMSHFFGSASGFLADTAHPRATANVFKKDDAYLVQIALPGIKPEDITLTVENGVLTVLGERTLDGPEGSSAHIQERAWKTVHRGLTLPKDADPESIHARFENGILEIKLDVAASKRPRRITIETN